MKTLHCKSLFLMTALLAAAFGATGAEVATNDFEILPLIDELDWLVKYDVEKEDGLAKVLDYVARTHPTTILWRDKAAGRMWIPNKCEDLPNSEVPLDKRLIPCCRSLGYLRLDRMGSVPKMRALSKRRGIGFGLHTGFEENHQIPSSESNWAMKHPEFACLNQAKMPRGACVSLAFPEVLQHKMDLMDDRLATKPEIIFLDTHRAGGWSVDIEYVKPVCDRWRAKYHCEPPDARDPRWLEICAENMNRYLRAFSKKCRDAKVKFYFGIQKLGGDCDYMWTRYAIDWRKLCREGLFDGLVVMGVRPDVSRPFESARELLVQAKRDAGDTRVYFQASVYPSNNGFTTFAKWAKVDNLTSIKTMLKMARELGYKGAILECVDPGTYNDAECQALGEARGIR